MTSSTALPEKIVILGAGHAGGSLAAFLRQFGHAGPVTLIGDEPYAPYQRPPLSKAWLAGTSNLENVLLRPEAWYASNDVDMRLSRRCVRIDRANRTVHLDNGDTIDYDAAIIATGARPRVLSLPGETLKNVFVLRSIDDADAIKNAITPGVRVALIGAGYIGLEVAASAVKAGAEAIVLEREPRCVARVACPAISEFLENYHRGQGVTFHVDAFVSGFAGEDAVEGVLLESGEQIPCDVAIVGAGVVPNDEIARDAGVDCSNGVEVDEDARSSDPHVFAIGDVSYRPLQDYDRRGRLESVPNALEQARRVASILTARKPPPAETPWFWSDQFDLKIQIAGLLLDADKQIVRGSKENAKFSVFHLKGDVVRAVESINAPPEFMMGRKWIAARTRIDPSRLADVSVPIKEVIKDA